MSGFLEPLPEGDWDLDYEPPVVRRVEHEGGSHVEPPFTEDMSDLEKLRHLAVLVESSTGIRIRVCDGASWTGGRFNRGGFAWQIGRTGGGDGSFHLAWTTLHGVELGATELKRIGRLGPGD